MSQFCYVLKPGRPDMLVTGLDEAEEAVVQEHFAYLAKLTEKGVVKLAGRTDTTGPESFGICIFDAEGAEAARALMEKDPAVREGVMTAELFPFRLALFGSPPED